MADNEVRMMMSVLPGAMTGFAALNSGLVSINNVFGSLTRSIDAQFGLIDTAIMTTGVVVTQLGIDAMNAFGNFEQGMKIVQMVSGQTSQEIDLLSQKANQFSVQYRMDIDQITEGLQTLGRAGLNSASEQAEVLENGLYTAKLEGRDLNSVLEELIQTTALLGGNLKSPEFGEQSGYVEDLMVATSMTAPITTHDVNETLKYSGGIAAAAGANIESEEGKAILEDYMGSIAAFAQKGVTGSIAGTALRAFFNKPATQDSSVTEALASINLKPEYLWEDDEQTMKPVSEQIRIINDQMKELNISTMDQLQIWSKIVGGKMGQQMMKLDANDIKELTSDIRAADDASSLATNSMKTYEANVKALGESGALLQRNVGEKLVFFANPILEILNKISSFANQDFMSWPIAIGIMSFIGLAGKKAFSVISALKSEIATLYSGMKQGLSYFTQKQGIVRVGDNPLDDAKERYKAYFQAKDEYYGRTPPTKGGGQQKVPTTLKEFSKSFESQIKQSGALTLQAFQKAGISNEKIALAGHLQGLTSAKNSMNLPEGQLWAAALKNNLISQEQFNTMFKAYGAGVNPRPTADLVGIESVIPQIKACEQALKDLGIAASEATVKPITAEEEREAAELAVSESIEATKQRITEEEIFREALNNEINESLAVIKEQVYSEGVFESAIRKESQAALDAAISTEVMAERIKMEFAEMATAVSASVSGMSTKLPNRMYPKTDVRNLLYSELPGYNSSYMFWGTSGGFKNLSPTMFGNIPSPYSGNYQNNPALYKEWINSGLGRAFGYNNLSDEKIAHYLAANRIPGYLNFSDKAQEIMRNNIKTYPDIGKDSKMPVYGPANDAGIKRALEIQRQAAFGTGTGVGNVPAIQDEIRRTTEAQKKAEAARIASLGAQSRNATKALENHQENIKKQQENITKRNLSTVQYGEDALLIDRERLAIEEEILMATRTRAESQKVSSSGMHGKGVPQNEAERFRQDAASGKYKTGDTLGRAGYSSKSSPDQVADKNLGKSFAGFREARAAQIKEQMENNSAHSKLLKQVNDIAQRNKNLSSTYMDGIAKNQQHAALFNTISKGYTGEASYISPGGRIAYDRMYAEKGSVGVVGPYTPINPLAFSGGSSQSTPNEVGKKTGDGFGSAFAKSFSERINRDRSGSFLSFGSETVNGVTRSATKGLSGLANKALNLTDAFGGPLMIAIMAVTTAIQMWQKAFQDYCEKLKEAENKLQEAYSNWSSAEDSLKKSFKEGNPDATDEEIDQMIYDTYSTMDDDMANAINNGTEEWFKKLNYKTETGPEYEYDEEKDDGSIKEKEPEELSAEEEYTKAIKENTGALYSASAELNKALDNYTRQATDSWWGLDGWTGKLTDNWMSVVGTAFGPLGIAVAEGVKEVTKENFSDNNEFLLTQSQKDENYAGYTEMAGLMLEDFKDAKGNWIKGMRTMMGDDVDDMAHTFKPGTSTYKYLKDMANFSAGIGAGGLTAQKNAKLQASMKNDPKTWKKLGKELAKRDTAKKAGKNIEKQEKRIEGIAKKINRSLGSGFSKTQILQAAYLQQLQDMYQIAEQAMVPIMQRNMETAMSTLSVAGQVDGNTGATVNTTDGTQQNAAIIASLVAIIAKSKAKELYFDTAVGGSTTEGHITDVTGDGVGDDKDVYWINKAREDGMDANKFYAEYSKAYDEAALSRKNIGGFGGFNAVWDWQKEGLFKDNDKIQEGALGYLRLYHATSKMEGYDYTPEKAAEAARKFALDVRDGGITLNDAIKTAEKNYQSDRYKQKIIDAYNLSGDDDDNGSGGGSGGGGGGGGGDSGNKDNTGTKKERVDLVLCNKKEIPKLNVNLFKKPPSFTILNKNFKLRDLKINTEDKPKAIMSSIKNAFIDVQKRSDPKIIQDEEAEYDPVAATDGNATPSGSAKTKTDSNKSSN